MHFPIFGNDFKVVTDPILHLAEEGYTHIIKKPTAGLCGLIRMVYTTGLVVGLSDGGYVGRYCYENKADAIEALKNWNGQDDPPGNWIKYKGEGGERRNPNYKTPGL